ERQTHIAHKSKKLILRGSVLCKIVPEALLGHIGIHYVVFFQVRPAWGAKPYSQQRMPFGQIQGEEVVFYANVCRNIVQLAESIWNVAMVEKQGKQRHQNSQTD